ncbi:52 kDa repressor of the inhibitor of the protein kinase-like isoform X1 [Photinus pyralis]|nr:52 kDa repressor of the inhibitor of the protein kinase-like isoform X1 [Photinus pyralis]XP_031338373.1 52 kDa repressor of the inhibitor of the protein kinase-like isoform X1 [Photinus pyralis]
MSGKFNGVQALIKSEQPLALYTHCFSHSLNLCISKSCEIPAIRNMMGILGSVSTFLSASAKRTALLEKTIQESDLKDTRKRKLKALCSTRWVERHESVLTFQQLFQPIVDTLEQLENDHDPNTSSKAAMFSSSLKRSDFIVSMGVAAYCLSFTLNLSKNLQSVDQDLSTALSHVDDVKSVLRGIRERSDEEFKSLYLQANKLASEVGATISMPRTCNRQTHRSNIGANAEDYYRAAIFVPFVDHVITQLRDRFDGICSVISLEGLIPEYLSKYDDMAILKAAEFYDQDMPGSMLELTSELKMWRQKWQGQQTVPKTAIEALKECEEMFFPNIRVLLQIFLVLPVTTATAERSFSVLRRLKTYLRSTMTEGRLNGLALANINSSRQIDVEEVISTFCKMKPRRLEMSSWD